MIAFREDTLGADRFGAIAPSGRGFRPLLFGASPFDLFGLPTFSPDGRTVAYSERVRPPGAGAYPVPPPSLHLANSHGADGREVPGPVPGLDPTWSPNGRELAFVRGERGLGLGIVGVDGQGARVLTADARDRDPAFSSRGQIAFVRGGDLYVMHATGSGLRRLTRSRAAEESPDFSPDGRRLVFASRGRHAWGGSDIFTMSARGGPARRLLRSPRWDDRPVWSPDGRQVAFTSGTAPGLRDIIATVGVNGRGYKAIRRLPIVDPLSSEGEQRSFSALTWQPRR